MLMHEKNMCDPYVHLTQKEKKKTPTYLLIFQKGSGQVKHIFLIMA